MKPIYIYGGVLLLLLLSFSLLGIFLTNVKWLRPRLASGYVRLCTLVFLLAAYVMAQYGWPGVHLRAVDLWSLLVILGILVYSLLKAALAYSLRELEHQDFSKSYMLSMLYTDSEQLSHEEIQAATNKELQNKRQP